MDRLNLKFMDEHGTGRCLLVERTPFTIGRHSACDLSYPDSRLSREHARIDIENGKFVLTDLGSSNGTTLNGSRIVHPHPLNEGDRIDLGGGLEIEVGIVVSVECEKPDEVGYAQTPIPGPIEATSASSIGGTSALAAAGTSGGIPTELFYLAPLLAIFVLAVVVGGIVIFGGASKNVADLGNDNSSGFDTTDIDEDIGPNTRPTAERTPSTANTPRPSNSAAGPTSEAPPSPLPNGDSEKAKVERNSTAFVREMARNDPRAFLTGEQASIVQAKVSQLARSSALAENINAARRNAAGIRSLAGQKNLRPHFLAAAAITKLGSSRGDVLQAAQSVADVYEKLVVQIGNENFDDALLMVAAYEQGAAGETMKMRNMLQSIAETPGSPGTREIRSIWYLKKAGRITQSEFDRAITFLAIGTIAQNPKDFGVNTEALRF